MWNGKINLLTVVNNGLVLTVLFRLYHVRDRVHHGLDLFRHDHERRHDAQKA